MENNGVNRKTEPRLVIVVPCYNEEKVLPQVCTLFLDEMNKMISGQKISADSRILFVNDGSNDNTWKIITEFSDENKLIEGISQSRNRGHQNAVLAGLMEVKEACDITISIDCDGQDDISAMEKMVDAYRDGAEIVYGVRNKREKDTFMKRFTAQSYYKILKAMGIEIIYNHADYRLVSSRVLKEFDNYKEVNLFLRGMFPLVGFNSACVYYDRNERMAGESHYTLGKMLTLAFDGVTSLSIKPIRLITIAGMIVSVFSFVGVIWCISRAIMGKTITGWASTTSIICFIGGIQLIGIGIIGEYIGKIYLETKARPRYIISERTYDFGNI